MELSIIDVMPPIPITKDYAGKIARAKFDWLKLTFPTFKWDHIRMVDYTNYKFRAAGANKGDILIDDNPMMRHNWQNAGGTAIPACDTMEFFRNHLYENYLCL